MYKNSSLFEKKIWAVQASLVQINIILHKAPLVHVSATLSPSPHQKKKTLEIFVHLRTTLINSKEHAFFIKFIVTILSYNINDVKTQTFLLTFSSNSGWYLLKFPLKNSHSSFSDLKPPCSAPITLRKPSTQK